MRACWRANLGLGSQGKIREEEGPSRFREWCKQRNVREFGRIWNIRPVDVLEDPRGKCAFSAEAALDPWILISAFWTVLWMAGSRWRFFWYSGVTLRNHCLGKVTTTLMLKMGKNEGYLGLVQLIGHMTLDLRVPSSSPMLGVETT